MLRPLIDQLMKHAKMNVPAIQSASSSESALR